MPTYENILNILMQKQMQELKAITQESKRKITGIWLARVKLYNEFGTLVLSHVACSVCICGFMHPTLTKYHCTAPT